jgi:hypothetical protein
MSEEPTQRDLEIRAAIDELSEANENVQRMLEEVRRWQQQNPPPGTTSECTEHGGGRRVRAQK